jgi:hypothetical protein
LKPSAALKALRVLFFGKKSREKPVFRDRKRGFESKKNSRKDWRPLFWKSKSMGMILKEH